MSELQAAGAALASLLALAHWARALPTRAWGDGAAGDAPARRRAWAVMWVTLLLQTATAVLALGWVGGMALVPAAWMLLGWLLVLAMNQWPDASLQWARWLGWAGSGVCAVTFVVQGVQAGLAG